jgi:type II secretory pathway component PulC
VLPRWIPVKTRQHPESAANLVLAGTIATSDPKRGVAIISDGGPAKVYSVGDNVGGAHFTQYTSTMSFSTASGC